MSQAALALPGKLSPERVDPFAWRSHRQQQAGRGAVGAKAAPSRRRAKPIAVLVLAAALLALGAHAGRVSPYLQPILTSLTPAWIAPVHVENVTSRLIDDGRTLLVEGTVVNISGRGLKSPALRLAIRASDASEIFVWTARPTEAHLAPDGRTRFSSRLAAPPNGGVEVAVALQSPGE